MITYTYFKEAVAGKMCRSCINTHMRGRLKSKECYYMYYQGVCCACKQPDKNIIEGIRMRKRYKLLMMTKYHR